MVSTVGRMGRQLKTRAHYHRQGHFRRGGPILTMRLSLEDYDALVAEAKRRGITLSDLAREFLKEGLQVVYTLAQ